MNEIMKTYHRNWQNSKYANDEEFRAVKVARVRAYRKAHPEALARSNALYRQRHRAANLLRHAKDRKKRRDYVALLKAKPCSDCGGLFPSVCMDFDHVNGTKVMSVSMMVTRSLEDLHAEINKCELVCANCHRLRTEKRRIKKRGVLIE
jgi:hypothetical protein